MEFTEDPKLIGLGSYLVAQGYLAKKIVQNTQKEALQKKIPFTTYLGEQHFLDYRTIAEVTAQYFGLPFADLNNYDLALLPLKVLSVELMQKYNALPLCKKQNQLTLAVSDPSILDINKINFTTNLSTSLIIVEIDKLRKVIDKIYTDQLQLSLHIEERDLDTVMEIPQLEKDLAHVESATSPVVKLLNKILLEAIEKQASDIHFEPYENFYRVRLRIDGILYEVNRQPIAIANFLTARLKVMASLDISERKVPQDGRFKLTLTKYHCVNFRLSTCPTQHGEKAVVRILETSTDLLDIETLGMNTQQKRIFSSALLRSQGLILVTGPTGSGKTTTLYSVLNKLNTSERNISTIEDPIEIQLPGINQVQVNTKFDLTFATVLRAFLRQDPDIIMVGEIRDLQTAEIAIRAAQTGHLVLSTLHTNSAAETLARLSDMGVPTFNIASSIILIIAQRLIRRLCDLCKISSSFSPSLLLAEGFVCTELHDFTVYQAQGCLHCNQGYIGRIGIYEVLPVSSAMANLIMQGAGSLTLSEQAKIENISNLRRCGLDKIKEGITSLEEVNRVIQH